jgi:hypothetical protein
MMQSLRNSKLSKEDLVELLSATGEEEQTLFDFSAEVKQQDEDELRFLDRRLKAIGYEIGYFRQGNSRHYKSPLQRV